MEKVAVAKSKFVGVSPVKVRIPADVVRGMNAREAIDVLEYMPKGTALHLKKVVESAFANAVNTKGMNPDLLFVSEVRIDQWPTLKRGRPTGKGGYARFVRKMCHISVVLKEAGVATPAVEKKTKKSEVKVETAEVETKKVEKKPRATKTAKTPRKTTKTAKKDAE